MFKSKGYNGYKNGTVTVWVQVVVNNEDCKINKVILAESEKQTLMSKFESSYFQYFTNDFVDRIKQGERFSPAESEDGIDNIMSGATKSANAICNAVNTVIEYVWGAK